MKRLIEKRKDVKIYIYNDSWQDLKRIGKITRFEETRIDDKIWRDKDRWQDLKRQG